MNATDKDEGKLRTQTGIRFRKWCDRHRPDVRDRLLRLNPEPDEAMIPRGWHPHHSFGRAYHLDVVGPRRFVEKFGREAYRKIPREVFVRNGHRKAIPRTYVVQFYGR